MTEEGVNGLSLAEVARRLGVQPPSIYKYFPSLMAVYDALFLRGQLEHLERMRQAMAGAEPGLDAPSRAGLEASGRWALGQPGVGPVAVLAPRPELRALAGGLRRQRGDGRAPTRRAGRRGRGRASSGPTADRRGRGLSRLDADRRRAQPGHRQRARPGRGARAVSPPCSPRSCACCPPRSHLTTSTTGASVGALIVALGTAARRRLPSHRGTRSS